MNKNIVIVHYNTPYLTECLVRSINLFVKDAIIYIFDNSDKKPFTAKFGNVSIIDNTKGQIINFDKWVKNYPHRFASGGMRNNCGSAKHCYSVEKCMEIIKENFVLMDSDILLKKDISPFFQEDCMYVGETVLQPSSNVERLLPFICFINTKMCKEKGIHYFDDNYMHGLRKTAYGDKFDTGAIFVKNASKFKHIDLSISNYIVHFNNASWMDTTNKKHYVTEEEWINRYKNLWKGGKNKKVIYTCIVGDYDGVIEPTFISNDFDYVCFTDSVYMRNGFWEIRPLPEEVKDLPKIKKQRYVKLHPHKLFPEYDLSIWVDGNVIIRGDLNDFLKETLKDDVSIYVPTHPSRDCVYKEYKVVLAMGKDKSSIVLPQIEKYKNEGFPKNYGLLQSNIIVRKHNNQDCINLMEQWFEEIKNGSHRDQLSFNYIQWKNEDIKISYMNKKICNSTWFYWRMTHSKTKPTYMPKVITRKKKPIVKEIKRKVMRTQDIALY